jgi:hypothetical protein
MTFSQSSVKYLLNPCSIPTRRVPTCIVYMYFHYKEVSDVLAWVKLYRPEGQGRPLPGTRKAAITDARQKNLYAECSKPCLALGFVPKSNLAVIPNRIRTIGNFKVLHATLPEHYRRVKSPCRCSEASRGWRR